MPNWCSNVITISHADPEMIEKIAAIESSDKGVLQTLIPCPEELLDPDLTTWSRDREEELEAKKKAAREKYGFESWYDWNIAHWGTKWDLSEPQFNRIDDNTIQISCETAWGPPLSALEALLEDGYEIRAIYYEGGMVFAGIWDNGVDQCFQEWGDSTAAKATLPQELDDMFGISESQAEWEEEERMEEELYAWTVGGAEKRKSTTKEEED